jgi:hypothetical protein
MTSSLTVLLNAVKAQVVASGLYRVNQVFVTLDPDPWPTGGGAFCAVRPGSHTLIDGQWEGAGQYLSGYSGQVTVRVIDRRASDEVGRDDLALLAGETGLIDRAMAVIDALTGDEAESEFLQSGVVQRGLVPSGIREPTVRKEDRLWRGIDLDFGVQWTHRYSGSFAPSDQP